MRTHRDDRQAGPPHSRLPRPLRSPSLAQDLRDTARERQREASPPDGPSLQPCPFSYQPKLRARLGQPAKAPSLPAGDNSPGGQARCPGGEFSHPGCFSKNVAKVLTSCFKQNCPVEGHVFTRGFQSSEGKGDGSRRGSGGQTSLETHSLPPGMSSCAFRDHFATRHLGRPRGVRLPNTPGAAVPGVSGQSLKGGGGLPALGEGLGKSSTGKPSAEGPRPPHCLHPDLVSRRHPPRPCLLAPGFKNQHAEGNSAYY